MSDPKSFLKKIYENPEVPDLEKVLSFDDEETNRILFDFANQVRKEFCGDAIFLRGIIEFSNYCERECFYCGLNIGNRSLLRYSLETKDLLKAVDHLAGCNIKTVVLQSGEGLLPNTSWLEEVIRKIKSKFDMAITLSVGERSLKDYRAWKDAGADRYLLKIETTNEKLYSFMHPNMSFKNRINCLDILKDLGYQVGSGIIIGLPGQTKTDIAKDIIFFKDYDFDMVGIGPFIAHPQTNFSREKNGRAKEVLKALALTRIVTKNTHLPATTALGSLEKDYRVDGLNCGANILMPNFTPQPYRKLYQIYPDKRCISEETGSCVFCMEGMAKSAGRHIDYSRGDSLKKESVGLNV